MSGFWNLLLTLIPIGVPKSGCKNAVEGVLPLTSEGLVKYGGSWFFRGVDSNRFILFIAEPEDRGVVGIARTLLISFVSLLLNVLAGELDKNNRRSAPRSSEFLFGVVNSFTLLEDFGVISKLDWEGPLLFSDSSGNEVMVLSFHCACCAWSLTLGCCCCCGDKCCFRLEVLLIVLSFCFGFPNSTLPLLL